MVAVASCLAVWCSYLTVRTTKTAGTVMATGDACPIGKCAAADYQMWVTCAATALQDRRNFATSPGLGSCTSTLELGSQTLPPCAV